MKIIYFASLKENLKTSSEDIELTDGSTVKQLREALSNKHGSQHFPDNILCAVNQEIANDSVIIFKSDKIAFYPPVTGG